MNNGKNLVNQWLQDLKHPRWQAFVYFNESPSQELDDMSETSLSGGGYDATPGRSIAALATAKVGDRVQIAALNCGESNTRLMGMGLIPGAVLEVVSCTATGSVIVALQDQRLGFGAEIAERIQVMAAQTESEAPDRPLANRTQTLQTPSATASLKLRDAAIGATMKVIGYEPTARDYKRKLLAMGLTPNTEFVVKRHAPLGDPTEIEVRGFRLSLRKAEADALMIEPIAGDAS
jgi:ferrous iron transport protein A